MAASTISFILPLGMSLSDATRHQQRHGRVGDAGVSARQLPGTANVFQQSLNSQLLLTAAAVTIFYVVLGILNRPDKTQ